MKMSLEGSDQRQGERSGEKLVGQGVRATSWRGAWAQPCGGAGSGGLEGGGPWGFHGALG